MRGIKMMRKLTTCPNCGQNTFNGIDCTNCAIDLSFDPNWD